jgi:lysophospholipase L1-like esterase
MRRKNSWTILILTNIISLVFLAIVSLRYQVPQKVLNKLGIIKRFNEELEKAAEEYGVEFIDINAELSENNILEAQYEDEYGVHLNLPGQRKWVEIIKPLIE